LINNINYLYHLGEECQKSYDHVAFKYRFISNYIKGKFCVCACVYVRYRSYLNVVGMGSKLLGVLRRNLRWSSNSQKFKKLILKIWFFKRETQKKWENRRRRETVTGKGTENSNGGRNGKRLRPEQCRVPPTSYCIYFIYIDYHLSPGSRMET
jgi:hypothetical protein